MDATVKRKARSPKGARGQALRPAEPAHESDGAHLELRIWLRLLSCATRIEKALNARRTFRLRLSQEGAKEFGRMARRHEEWVIALIGELSPVAQSDLLQHLTLLKRRLDKHT